MKPLKDSQYDHSTYTISERKHHYGKQVHLLSDPFLHSHLATLCSTDTFQPLINELITTLYSSLIQIVANAEFAARPMITASRMSEFHPEGIFESPIIDPDVPVVSVNLARAGTVPSHVCYSSLNYFMNPKNVRQDHINIARGAGISGHKIGGPVDDSIVIFPDPMAATGGTICEVMDLYKKNHGNARKYIAVHCIVTPEYLKQVQLHHPELAVYAIRLDRGLSSEKILSTVPGTHWEEEKGLNEHQYIVPGGGGFGEILNNSYV